MKKIFLFLILFLSSLNLHAASLKKGDMAPDFKTTDEQGKAVSLKDFRGRAVVLYFYPKDDTPGCTLEAQQFRDHYSEFENLETVILGISFDSKESHQKFKAKHQLPFPLLVDPDKKIAEAYGASGLFMPSRDVFVIDENGKIMRVMRSVDPAKVVGELLKNAY